MTSVAEGRSSMERLSLAIENIKNSSDQTARIVKTSTRSRSRPTCSR